MGLLSINSHKMDGPYAVYDHPFPTDSESLKEVLTYFQTSDEFFAVELKTTGKVIGFVSLNYIDDSTRNLGYCIHSAYQNNGFAKEAVAEIINYARETLKLKRLISGTAEANIPSMKLLKSAGFAIKEKSEGSFVTDKTGNSILFTGYSFEYGLRKEV